MTPDPRPVDRRRALVALLRAGGLGGGTAAAALWLHGRSHRPEEPLPLGLRRDLRPPAREDVPDLVVARGEDPRAAVRGVIQALGGIGRFVSRGDVVAIKPNMAWDRTPEQAANTNPEVVAEVVRLCLEAGAARVLVGDVSTNEPQRVYQRSGIAAAARAEGAEIILPERRRFRRVDLRGEVLSEWPVFDLVLRADKVINIPIAKHHSLTGATLGIKNWYGILGGQRHRLHQRIHESLADLASFIRPTLTIIDAWRVLVRNGPTGGNLADVELRKTLIAGVDPVALDAWAAKAYWDLDEGRMRYLTLAAQRGLGTPRFEKLRIATVEA
ncbi:MAG: DUF362 domain-containing protein [Bryobacteraceae bacterium]